MTSISAASTNTYQSPLQKLQDELLSEIAKDVNDQASELSFQEEEDYR